MLINFIEAVEDVLIESEGNSKRLTMAFLRHKLWSVPIKDGILFAVTQNISIYQQNVLHYISKKILKNTSIKTILFIDI